MLTILITAQNYLLLHFSHGVVAQRPTIVARLWARPLLSRLGRRSNVEFSHSVNAPALSFLRYFTGQTYELPFFTSHFTLSVIFRKPNVRYIYLPGLTGKLPVIKTNIKNNLFQIQVIINFPRELNSLTIRYVSFAPRWRRESRISSN